MKLSQNEFLKNSCVNPQVSESISPPVYKYKIMLKNIENYVQMKNMIALITESNPNSCSDDDKYPRLLILVMPSLKSILDNFYLYEIPSSLHMIDISKAQFVTSENTLI